MHLVFAFYQHSVTPTLSPKSVCPMTETWHILLFSLIYPQTEIMGCDGPLGSCPSNCHFSRPAFFKPNLSVIYFSEG